MTPAELYADDLMVRWLYQSHKARHPIGPNRRRTTDQRLHANARKAFCVNGHPFDDANTIAYPDRRRCRTCDRANERNRRLRPVGRTQIESPAATLGRDALSGRRRSTGPLTRSDR